MTYATLEKTVWVEIDKEDLERIDKDGEITKEVYLDVELWEFDDEDIRAEYFERFCVELEEQDWRRLYEQRRSLPVEDFLKIIDTIIMDNSGRVL